MAGSRFITNANYDQWVRMCRGKHKHTGPKAEERAEIHRVSRETATGEPFNKYRCAFCGAWHVGHNRRAMALAAVATS